MARGRVCGTFGRQGGSIIGRIGPLTARWDRHRGGVLAIAHRPPGPGRRAGPSVEFTACARVTKEHHPWLVSQANDSDARLIFCEEGPERLVMRVMYALVDDRGQYHGDGVCYAVLWANGDAHIATAIRFVDLTAHDTVTDAWVEARLPEQPDAVEVGTRSRTRLSPARLRGPRWFRLPGGVPGRSVVARSADACVAFAWFNDGGNCYEDLGGVGAWAGPGSEAPYYDRWGHLYEQWGGETGWRAHESAALGLAGAEDGFAFTWHWLRDVQEKATPNMAFRALLALRFGDEVEAVPSRRRPSSARQRPRAQPTGRPHVRDRLNAFHNPIVPVVEGGEFRCLDVLENALVVKKTAEVTKLTFRRDALGRTAHVRLYGLSGTGGVMVGARGSPIVPHLVSHGGVTDDPYGPNHIRPGDRHAPLIGDPAVPPDEVVFSVPLSRRGKTIVTVRETPGINLAYLKWDDRRTFVIRASGLDAPLAEFSARTLCLHNLRARADIRPALVRLPLYWYQCNASTPLHCLNILETLRLQANGPEALRFELVSHNRGQRARSTMGVVIPAVSAAPVVRVNARLDVLRQWDLPAIQYLNSFPGNSWQPRDWPRDWVVLVDTAGHVTERFFKERLDGERRGDPLIEWRDRLVFVQGAADCGNIAIYVANTSPARQRHAYRLCSVWLDSHFEVVNPKAPLRAGRRFETEYVLAVGGDQRLTRAQAGDIARKALSAGTLDPEWLAT